MLLLSTKFYQRINKRVHIMKYNLHTVIKAMRQNKLELWERNLVYIRKEVF